MAVVGGLQEQVTCLYRRRESRENRARDGKVLFGSGRALFDPGRDPLSGDEARYYPATVPPGSSCQGGAMRFAMEQETAAPGHGFASALRLSEPVPRLLVRAERP